MRALVVSAVFALATVHVCAYVAERAWPTGDRAFYLNLDDSSSKPALPSAGLQDGSANWNAVASSAIASWNAHLTRIQIKTTVSNATAAKNNQKNDVTFAADVYGEDFGTNVLAITLTSSISNVQMSEADVLVNNKYTWDSYRGSLKNSPLDLRRVLIHELGHALGLNHPDEYGQSIRAIMNAQVSNVDDVTADDIAGAEALYKNAIKVPTVTRTLQSRTVTATQSADLYVETDGGTPPEGSPTLFYNWTFRAPGGSTEELGNHQSGRLALGTAQTYDSGQYRLRIETPDGNVDGGSATLTVNPVAKDTATHLLNLSTRGLTGVNGQPLIVGFVIKSASTRRLLIRGVGPTLGDSRFNLSGAVPDPKLELHGSGDGLLATNDNWSTSPGVTASVFQQAGAFSLPANSKDAAVLVDLGPGSYTAVISPSGATGSGIGIVEVYDLSPTTTPSDRLINLSTRGYVGKGEQSLFGGFVITGSKPRTYLIRLVGDTLQNYNVTNTLDDPMQRLNIGSTLARYVDDWDMPASRQALLRSAMESVGAFSLTDRQESAMLVTLQPGAYTVQGTGFDSTTGVALFEVYETDL